MKLLIAQPLGHTSELSVVEHIGEPFVGSSDARRILFTMTVTARCETRLCMNGDATELLPVKITKPPMRHRRGCAPSPRLRQTRVRGHRASWVRAPPNSNRASARVARLDRRPRRAIKDVHDIFTSGEAAGARLGVGADRLPGELCQAGTRPARSTLHRM
jgi:hypothetical protein